MALFDTARPTAFGRQATRPVGFFGQLVGMFAVWNDARITRNALNRLSEHELNDVGLTRGDIDRVTRQIHR